MNLMKEIAAYAVFGIVVGLLSVWPSYEFLDEQSAIISIVFSHAGDRIGECRRLTQEELNALPPNMRKPNECPRERHPIRVELRSGEQVLFSETLLPSGIWADGKANVYRRIAVPVGVHELYVGMNDSGTADGFDVDLSARLDVTSGRNVVIQFDEQLQQFSID